MNKKPNYSVELIIHDDCSTDDNLKKINNVLSEEYINVVKIFQNENQLGKNKIVTGDLLINVKEDIYHG